MLELGLWETAESLVAGLKKSSNQMQPRPVSQRLLRHVQERLAHRCGDIFASIVRRCLTGEFEVSRGNLFNDEWNLNRCVMEQVVDPLENSASVI